MLKHYVVGIDEVGRGSLAGPITVAAIAVRLHFKSKITNNKLLRGIRDSKRLSAKQREEWFKKLTAHLKAVYAHASVGNAIIDKKNISYATRLAIKRVIKKLEKNYQLSAVSCKLFLDGGLKAPEEYINQRTIIKGDEKVSLIAAASIIAKVVRDRKMKRFARKYPLYGFEIHKGYGTLLHRNSIKAHGLCEIHRTSFCKKFI